MNKSTTLKFARLAGGFLLLAAGVILCLPFVPGPGIPLILAALLILGEHFAWAKRLLDWAKSKFQRLGFR